MESLINHISGQVLGTYQVEVFVLSGRGTVTKVGM